MHNYIKNYNIAASFEQQNKSFSSLNKVQRQKQKKEHERGRGAKYTRVNIRLTVKQKHP